MEVMLDTNAYSDWGRSGLWSEMMRSASAVTISPISLGELYHGFRKGSRYEENLTRLDAFLDNRFVQVVEVDQEVSKVFGELLVYLQSRGTPLPTNDIWIASCAYVRGVTLLTSDRHFEKLPQVSVRFPEG